MFLQAWTEKICREVRDTLTNSILVSKKGPEGTGMKLLSLQSAMRITKQVTKLYPQGFNQKKIQNNKQQGVNIMAEPQINRGLEN